MTILEDTKTYLGLMEDDPSFDSEVKDAIDNALATATQLNRDCLLYTSPSPRD